jgi:hypothetical protein
MTTRRVLIVVGVLLAGVVIPAALVSATRPSYDWLAGLESLEVTGYPEPWHSVGSGSEGFIEWTPSGHEQYDRRVFLEIADYLVPAVADWQLSKRGLRYYKFGNLRDHRIPESDLLPLTVIRSGLAVSGERIWCAAGDANERCTDWIWHGRDGRLLFVIGISDVVGLSQESAVSVVREILGRRVPPVVATVRP